MTRRLGLRLLLAACLATTSVAAARPLVLHDDRERTLRLPGPPSRIVSLAPHATELLFAAGLGPAVVAVDRDSDFPPQVNGLPRVAALPQPSVERLLGLKPDLVVTWGPGVRPGFVEQLEAFGVPVFVSEPRTLDGVSQTLRRFAALAGEPDGAQASVAGAFEERLAALRERWQDRSPVPVFVQVWGNPLIAVGAGDVMDDALRTCGGLNVAARLPTAAPRVDIEWVLAARPRLVVATDSPAAEQRWREVGLLPPAGDARFVHLDPTLLQRPGPRLLDAVEQLCEAIDAAR